MNCTADPPVGIPRGVVARPRIHRLSRHTIYPSGATDFGTCWCVRQDRVPTSTEVVTDPASLELGTGGSPVTYTMLADMQWISVYRLISSGAYTASFDFVEGIIAWRILPNVLSTSLELGTGRFPRQFICKGVVASRPRSMLFVDRAWHGFWDARGLDSETQNLMGRSQPTSIFVRRLTWSRESFQVGWKRFCSGDIWDEEVIMIMILQVRVCHRSESVIESS
ncbi:uncharacterized protein EDB91DRAFT_1085782 [Suillus paluster]|uniref:uncharacterized protein n=1 Tax=Suillus paluster TaxID=48578 RepID=UPI001B863698|nr:uncharacterized protein EDB91DRAFT_1085782 [Suillus paluster]KAG1729345.1 hypothetical protein EDB91DRAFT_1085782 [Suillus paluster]